MGRGIQKAALSSVRCCGNNRPVPWFHGLALLYYFISVSPAVPGVKPAAPGPSLEAAIGSARNVLVVRVVKRYPRDERLSYRGHKGSYATAGLEVEVRAALIGDAMTGDRFQVVYLKAVESKIHGFRPGGDYLLVLKEKTPDFLDVTPWEQADGAYAIQGGYLSKAPLLDLVSAFWVGPPERKVGRLDLNRWVQKRLEAIRVEFQSNPEAAPQ